MSSVESVMNIDTECSSGRVRKQPARYGFANMCGSVDNKCELSMMDE